MATIALSSAAPAETKGDALVVGLAKGPNGLVVVAPGGASGPLRGLASTFAAMGASGIDGRGGEDPRAHRRQREPWSSRAAWASSAAATSPRRCVGRRDRPLGRSRDQQGRAGAACGDCSRGRGGRHRSAARRLRVHHVPERVGGVGETSGRVVLALRRFDRGGQGGSRSRRGHRAGHHVDPRPRQRPAQRPDPEGFRRPRHDPRHGGRPDGDGARRQGAEEGRLRRAHRCRAGLDQPAPAGPARVPPPEGHEAPRAGRQGHHLRLRRHLDQAGRCTWRP